MSASQEPSVKDSNQFVVKGIVGRLDSEWSSLQVEPSEVILDLSATKYIEVASLVYIIAILSSRNRRGLKTRMKLPESKDVRDMLRSWNFQSAVETVTRNRLQHQVDPADLRFFGENEDLRDQKYVGMLKVGEAGRFQRLLSTRYFPIYAYTDEEIRFNSTLPYEVSHEWREIHVMKVITAQIADSVSRNVICEAMKNAISHPNANSIIVASQLDPSNRLLTMVVWDDGSSIVDTLVEALRQTGSIYFTGAPRLSVRNEVIIEDPDGNRSEPIEWVSDQVPDLNTPEELILLSSTFPGITRDTRSKRTESSDRDTDGIAVPGMGLYWLTNAAVDTYSGEVAIRSREFFMNMSKGDRENDSCHHRVKIKRYTSAGRFPGNMVTVRIPVGDITLRRESRK